VYNGATFLETPVAKADPISIDFFKLVELFFLHIEVTEKLKLAEA
jgi:hypothetical protein